MREDAWLGERLGCAAWTIEDHDDDDEMAARGSGFFQAKIPATCVRRVGELEELGFRTIDVNITLGIAAGAGVPTAPLSVRDARPGDREPVLEIAARDYAVSRFHRDPAIPDAVASAIKRDWVDNFFRGGRGDRLLVVDAEGVTVGFLLVLETAEHSVIDLIAVAAAARGMGAGHALVAGLGRARPERPIVVGTQVANVAALRFYERLGFRVQQSQFVLHRHS